MATKIEDLIEFHAFHGGSGRCVLCERDDRKGTFLAVNGKTRVDGVDRFVCDECGTRLARARDARERAPIRWGSW